MFVLGYALQRTVIATASHGREDNILLLTLGLSIVIEHLESYLCSADARTINPSYAFDTVDVGIAFLAVPKLISFVGAPIVTALLWLVIQRTDLGRAIRAVARERQGARLVGIDVEHIFAMSFGIGIACVGAAACLLLPSYYAHPGVGESFVVIAFTIVVLGGMGSFVGALIGGFIIGLTESLGGLFLGENLGRIGVFVIFIAILLFRPTGLFGQRA